MYIYIYIYIYILVQTLQKTPQMGVRTISPVFEVRWRLYLSKTESPKVLELPSDCVRQLFDRLFVQPNFQGLAKPAVRYQASKQSVTIHCVVAQRYIWLDMSYAKGGEPIYTHIYMYIYIYICIIFIMISSELVL